MVYTPFLHEVHHIDVLNCASLLMTQNKEKYGGLVIQESLHQANICSSSGPSMVQILFSSHKILKITLISIDANTNSFSEVNL
jgi:hypothetical protein